MLCVWLPVCPPCSTHYQIEMDITLPTWPSLMGPFLKGFWKGPGAWCHLPHYSRVSCSWVYQHKCASGVRVVLSIPDCHHWGKKTMFLLEGSACSVITEHSGVFSVLCMNSYAQTPTFHCCWQSTSLNQFKGNFSLNLWEMN